MAEGDEGIGLNKTNALATGSSREGAEERLSSRDDVEATIAMEKTGKRHALEQSKSYATTTSAASGIAESSSELKPKPWYKKLNPLRWGSPPPVPETREVSREYKATFLSILVFQWMAPLMSVNFCIYPVACELL
jgi:hypothetical protein